MNLPYPSLTARDEAGRYQEIRRYLFRLVETLNVELGGQAGASGGDETTKKAISDVATELRALITTNARDTELRFDAIKDEVSAIGTQTGANISWTWRKWKNGTAECWGTWSESLEAGDPVGNLNPFTATVTFPTALFASAPLVSFTGNVGTGATLQGGTGTVSASSAGVTAFSASSGTQNCEFMLFARGRWQ